MLVRIQRGASIGTIGAVTALLGIAAPVLSMSQGADSGVDWKAAREFWCFKSPTARLKPRVSNSRWPRTTIDYFILARLSREKSAPQPPADRSTLLRRLTLDLTGIPPTADELDAFLADSSADPYLKLANRLLASPRFGERMASMWLPLARYAEDQAHQVGSDTKFFYPNAYKYRAWVIDAFNRDLPYDRFIKLQLAADRYLNVKATSGAEATEEGEIPDSKDAGRAPDAKASTPADLAALGFLGLGPKYYNRGRVEVMADEWEDRVDTVSRTFLGLTVACARCHDHKFEPVTQRDYYALAGVFASTKMINRRPDGSAEKAGAMADKMDPATLHVVEDGAPVNLNIFLRGNPENKGPVAERGFLRALSSGEPEAFKDGSGRKELAESIANRGNPLTARVYVNRVWGLIFGRPLIDTPSNLGRSGSSPSHPDLLDDLAVRFMQNGWSTKWLVRELVLSSTYRQRSSGTRASNELLAGMNRKRMTIEQWRDSVMSVSGTMKTEDGKSKDLLDPENHQRTVYAHVSRLKLNDMQALFDYPDSNVHAEKRAVTTTAPQKLFMLNSPFIITQAGALAARLTANPNEDNRARVRNAYRLLYSRNPEKEELDLALIFLARPESQSMKRWDQYAQILLASNEMIYID